MVFSTFLQTVPPGPLRARRLFSLTVAISLAICFSPAAHGEEIETLIWTGRGASSDWSDRVNWEHLQAPQAVEGRPVLLNPGQAIHINLDRDQVLRGGLRMDFFRGRIQFFLRGHALSVEGDEWVLGGLRNSPRFSEGTLRLGSAEAPLALTAFSHGGDDDRVVFRDTLRLDPRLLSSLRVAISSGNRTAVGTLDLSAVQLESSALRVTGPVVIGEYRGHTPGRSAVGELILPPGLGEFSMGELVLGRNLRDRGGDRPSFAKGTIDFGTGAVLRLLIRDAVIIASGDMTTGRLTSDRPGMEWVVGSPGSPAVMRIAVKEHRQSDAEGGVNETEAVVRLGGRLFVGHLETLRVAENKEDGGGATAEVDLKDFEKTWVKVEGEAVIGAGAAARGSLALGPGEVEFRDLTLGGPQAGAEGILELHGTRTTVEGELRLHSGSELRLLVSPDDEPGWMLRLRGDQRETIGQAVADGRIVAFDGVGEGEWVVQTEFKEGDTLLSVVRPDKRQ